jgi:chromosome segregation ATPase
MEELKVPLANCL